ncbi:DUF5937 family protein [Actinoplanes sp. NPDC051851]|uniref:ArsR/SmtB family transcription factor n=1 Tax=Actinoplanes sp. NPDC051851 TaxID=3154753 RepID=UPI0034142A0D
MVAIALPAGAAARIRFAVSCLWEVVTSVREPAAGTRILGTRPRPTGLLGRLVRPTGGYTPDFLTPPPLGLVADLGAELAALRATPSAAVRAHLDLMPGDPPAEVRALHADPPAGLARLSGEIEEYWRATIAPAWPRIHALLDADVRRRAHRLATDGAATVLNDLHESVHWADGTLTADQRHCTAPDVPDGSGLVLIPSVFAWPSVLTVSSWGTPQLAYPAQGVATLWEEPSRAPDPLGALLGRGRARILAALAGPLSTTELAGHTGISAGGVSQQLRVLRDAGLVRTHREGRRLLNSRTPIADALLAATGGHTGRTNAEGLPEKQVTDIR